MLLANVIMLPVILCYGDSTYLVLARVMVIACLVLARVMVLAVNPYHGVSLSFSVGP